MEFKDFKLKNKLLQAIEEKGYVNPTPIQQQAIIPILEGKDVLGCAQTGTGKTAAFAIPILNNLQHQNYIQVLVMTPTRELAIQIKENFDEYGKHLQLKSAVIFGGVNQQHQVREIRKGVDVLIATPGRLIDLMNQDIIRLDRIKVLVLDEADNMLDMGFIRDINKIISAVPKQRQSLLFSATMPKEIKSLAQKILTDEVEITVKAVSSTVDTVSQQVYFVDTNNKPSLLKDVLKQKKPKSALVFTRTKHGADKVVKFLIAEGFKAAAIHGNKSQANRQRTLKDFKAGNLQVLVATDIAARGLDINYLSLVVNYEIPNIPETYVHRIGRTGRAKREGDSISFVNFEEKMFLLDIEKLIKKRIDIVENHHYPLSDFTIPPKQKQRPRNKVASGGKKPSKKSKNSNKFASSKNKRARTTNK